MAHSKRICNLKRKEQFGGPRTGKNYDSTKDYKQMKKKIKNQKASRRRNRGS